MASDLSDTVMSASNRWRSSNAVSRSEERSEALQATNWHCSFVTGVRLL